MCARLSLDLCPQPLLLTTPVVKEILYEKALTIKYSGNEVYCTACSFLVILKISCSNFHHQKVVIQKPFYTRSTAVSSGLTNHFRIDMLGVPYKLVD